MRERGFGLRLRVFDLKQAVHGNQLSAQLLAGLRIRMLFQPGNNLVIFYNMEYFFVHISYLKAILHCLTVTISDCISIAQRVCVCRKAFHESRLFAGGCAEDCGFHFLFLIVY